MVIIVPNGEGGLDCLMIDELNDGDAQTLWHAWYGGGDWSCLPSGCLLLLPSRILDDMALSSAAGTAALGRKTHACCFTTLVHIYHDPTNLVMN